MSPVHTSLLVPYLCPLKDRLEPAGPSREQGEVSPSDPWGQVALIHHRAWKGNSENFAFWASSEVRIHGVLRSTHADEVCEEVLKALEETEG